jgi:hypothetical protein
MVWSFCVKMLGWVFMCFCVCEYNCEQLVCLGVDVSCLCCGLGVLCCCFEVIAPYKYLELVVVQRLHPCIRSSQLLDYTLPFFLSLSLAHTTHVTFVS